MSKVTLPPPRLAGGPYIMGVLNLAPDFSECGERSDGAATPQALAMLEAGADIIDIVGVSIDATAVSAEEEMARVVPVIASLRATTRAPVSINTTKPAVALAAAHVGATLWTDVNALRAPGALESAASLHHPVIVRHGDPRGMQAEPVYDDVIDEVISFLEQRVALARAKGVDDIWVDPGIGVGKTPAENLALLAAIGRLAKGTGCPVLISPDAIAGDAIAVALAAARNGAQMIRVHDVAATVRELTGTRPVPSN